MSQPPWRPLNGDSLPLRLSTSNAQASISGKLPSRKVYALSTHPPSFCESVKSPDSMKLLAKNSDNALAAAVSRGQKGLEPGGLHLPPTPPPMCSPAAPDSLPRSEVWQIPRPGPGPPSPAAQDLALSLLPQSRTPRPLWLCGHLPLELLTGQRLRSLLGPHSTSPTPQKQPQPSLLPALLSPQDTAGTFKT